MRTICIMNLKGGVAKTTTAINVAAILAAEYRQRVLLIDADSQCNTTEFFGGIPEEGNLARVLRATEEPDGGVYAVSQIRPTDVTGIDLLAGDDSLMDLDLTKVETGTVRATVLRDMVALLTDRKLYDWILVDCPPSFNAAAAAALIAADEVVIPCKLDGFSLRGMTNIVQQINNMRTINPGLRLTGILPTMYYKAPEIEAAEQTLRDSGLPVYHPIRRTVKVDKMTFEQEPLRVVSPNCAAGVDYRRFVRQLARGRCA